MNDANYKQLDGGNRLEMNRNPLRMVKKGFEPDSDDESPNGPKVDRPTRKAEASLITPIPPMKKSDAQPPSTANDDDYYSTKKGAVHVARVRWSEDATFSPYLIASVVIGVAEPVLVAFPNVPACYDMQIFCLVIATILFVFSLLCTASYIPIQSEVELSFSGKVMLVFRDGEVLAEALILLFGWACIIEAPAIASLRCFRLFRFLWYMELIHEEFPEDYDPSEHWVSLKKSTHLCYSYLVHMSAEIFTAKSNGGTIVLALYFFVTYIFAVVFWSLEGGLSTVDGQVCDTLTHCFITLMRLSFYDGTGFDFFTSVVDTDPPLSLLLYVYLIASAMILLNGLIGIFGTALANASANENEAEGKSHSSC